jgi:hypothetical protein
VRIASAAILSLLVTTPTLAAAAAIHVGLVVTEDFARPLVGTWDAKFPAKGTIYHFVVSGSFGVFYELVSVPAQETASIAVSDVLGAALGAGRCDLRLSGVINSLEEDPGAIVHGAGGQAHASYEMRYSIQSAEVITSSTDLDRCKQVASTYVSDAGLGAASRLLLSRASDGSLIDSVSGTQYFRAR